MKILLVAVFVSTVLLNPLAFELLTDVGGMKAAPAAWQRGDPQSQGADSDHPRDRALFLLEGVLSTTHQITPIHLRIRTEIEVGLTLLDLDEERAIALLADCSARIRQLLDEKNETTVYDPRRRSPEQLLLFRAVRRLMSVRPELARTLLLQGRDEYSTISDRYTLEARALLSVAAEHLDSDIHSAARLLEESVRFGRTDWSSFLSRLAQRDQGLAERTAINLIDRLALGSADLDAFNLLTRFVFAPEQSMSLRSRFLQVVTLRIRRALHPAVTRNELLTAMATAGSLRNFVQRYSGELAAEMDGLAAELRALFVEREFSPPGPYITRTIDARVLSPAESGDTLPFLEAFEKAQMIADADRREQEYRRLAIEAGIKGDVPLAEEIMFRMKNEALKRETSLHVYSPLVRASIRDKNWATAEKHALSILEPLGRTLALCEIGRAMAESRVAKDALIETHLRAAAALEKDTASTTVAQGFLLLSRALDPLDGDGSLEMARAAVFVLNRLNESGWKLEDDRLPAGISLWVPSGGRWLQPEELLDLVDLVGATFSIQAARDPEAALSTALGLKDYGLYSMAKLSVCRVLFERAREEKAGAVPVDRS